LREGQEARFTNDLHYHFQKKSSSQTTIAMKELIPTTTFFYLSFFLLLSCNQTPDDGVTPVPGSGGNSNNTWSIPQDEVFDGGPGKDGIPSVDDPKFSNVGDIDFLAPDDLVLGIKVGNEVRAYPHPVLDWHEIVNDVINGTAIAITYCPLTGTGIGWHREIGNTTTTFGVSGLLYNTNLIPYDRSTNSNWSQMLLKSVNGDLMGDAIETYPLVETTWQTWKTMFPDSKVMNSSTGFSRNYDVYPYGNYKTNNDLLLFPISTDDGRLPRKQRGLGVIISEKAKFYPFDQFDADVTVKQDVFKNVDLVIVGSTGQNFLAAYERKLPDGTVLDFTAINESGNPVVMTDNEGNEWNLFGEAVAGPREGTALIPAQSFIGYWFSWGAFYPNAEIY